MTEQTNSPEMTIETIATGLHKETGFTGKKLEAATLYASLIFAQMMGNKEAEAHFGKRLEEAVQQGIELGEIKA